MTWYLCLKPRRMRKSEHSLSVNKSESCNPRTQKAKSPSAYDEEVSPCYPSSEEQSKWAECLDEAVPPQIILSNKRNPESIKNFWQKKVREVKRWSDKWVFATTYQTVCGSRLLITRKEHTRRIKLQTSSGIDRRACGQLKFTSNAAKAISN